MTIEYFRDYKARGEFIYLEKREYLGLGYGMRDLRGLLEQHFGIDTFKYINLFDFSIHDIPRQYLKTADPERCLSIFNDELIRALKKQKSWKVERPNSRFGNSEMDSEDAIERIEELRKLWRKGYYVYEAM